ncbi:uncharacterized protein LOC119834605 [Zerene cesonia]|uniref:uncharacterized protein LOC119834605 n=1 Tax=Zerene cesonia TaxID=33412 RepID=UPI0018E4DCFF|nr:uncharacterized protein LOC119834605 [Zerene cesonia]
MNHFNINSAVNCIKTLVDNCRCVNCDQLNNKRLRYICGHSICEKCVAINTSCMLCSPSSNTSTFLDIPQTERVKHASELLNTFQDLLNVDVYRQLRISEQLKVERELFPECIQAPMKYCNKRKSSIFTQKENLRPAVLPGEIISSSEKAKMEKSVNYVQEWLNQNETSLKTRKVSRKPFADLNINTRSNINITKSKKRTLNNSILSETFNKGPKKIKKEKSIELTSNNKKTLCENYESGIGLEDDTFIIDDSQSDILDKDKLALMAVMEADQNESSFIDADIDLNKIETKELPKCCFQSTSSYKVPFYKKALLTENCFLCVKDLEKKEANKKVNNTKNLIVTIDSKSFMTTIKISDLKSCNNGYLTKASVAVQTDDSYEIFDANEESTVTNDVSSEAINNINIKDIFKKDVIRQNNDGGNKSKCLIIEDSDDDSLESEIERKEVEVEAEVHRSGDLIDYVLTPLEYPDYNKRARSTVRGKTPVSSDSSDKENFDPNKKKRFKYNKIFKSKKLKK